MDTIISQWIPSQFPSFYGKDGPLFVAFIKAYYEWLYSEGQVINQSRSLSKTLDVDTTPEEFIKYFKNEFMMNIPLITASNQNFLIKHILDLYRAKGTKRGYELLFRILFNEDIKIYYPGQYLFTPSDNTWVVPKYIEVTSSPFLKELEGLHIYSPTNGASAMVESYNIININNQNVNVLYISNIQGNFTYGCVILSDQLPELTPSLAPIVIGSLAGVSLTSGGAQFNVGDLVNINGSGATAIGRVFSTRQESGKVSFNIINGGFGFSNNPSITVSGGGGTGATFKVGKIVNQTTLTYNSDTISPYLALSLNAASWGFPSGGGGNLTSTIASVLTYQSLVVGTIAQLTAENPGSNYSFPPQVNIIEPAIAALNIPDGLGGFLGKDALISTQANSANGIITALSIEDSGFGFSPGEALTVTSNNPIIATGQAIVNGVGKSKGYWTSNKSFPSDEIFLQDSYYRQKFSYEIQAPRLLSSYESLVKDLVHPIQTVLFGKFSMVDFQSSQTAILVNPSFSNLTSNGVVGGYEYLGFFTQGGIVGPNSANLFVGNTVGGYEFLGFFTEGGYITNTTPSNTTFVSDYYYLGV